MKKVFFKPWVGKDYGSGGIFGKKILVLGEAHLCNECENCGHAENAEECADFTSSDCIEVLLSGKTGSWTGTFRKFERSLVNHETDLDESRRIWHSLAFYNYVQKAMSAARKTPEWVDFRDSEDAFFEVIDELQPDHIIVWGVTRMYDLLPGGERWREGEPLEIDGYSIKTATTALPTAKKHECCGYTTPPQPFHGTGGIK